MFHSIDIDSSTVAIGTVNSEIFARVLFFMKIKPSQIGEITLSFIDIGKSSLSCEFLTP